VPAKKLHRLTFQLEVHCSHRVELREGVDDLRQAKGLAPRAAALLVFRTGFRLKEVPLAGWAKDLEVLSWRDAARKSCGAENRALDLLWLSRCSTR